MLVDAPVMPCIITIYFLIWKVLICLDRLSLRISAPQEYHLEKLRGRTTTNGRTIGNQTALPPKICWAKDE